MVGRSPRRQVGLMGMGEVFKLYREFLSPGAECFSCFAFRVDSDAYESPFPMIIKPDHMTDEST